LHFSEADLQQHTKQNAQETHTSLT